MNRRIVLTQDMAWDCLKIYVLKLDDFVQIVATIDESDEGGDAEISQEISRIQGSYDWRKAFRVIGICGRGPVEE